MSQITRANSVVNRSIARVLALIERVGNRLPDPATLFVILGAAVLLLSVVGSQMGWSVVDPREPAKSITVDNLLDSESVRWMFTSALRNFLDFPPLAIVLVAMLGIGVAERTGLFPSMLKMIVTVTPSWLLTPVVVFIGVNASAAADSGYVVLPPLAAGVFAMVGRSPVVGIAAATFGIAGGFSANVAITSLDPLLSSLTQQAARSIDPAAIVAPTANYWFMLFSTFFLTALGWLITDKVVEPRFTPTEVQAQITCGGLSVGDGSINASERKGLWAAMIAFVLTGAVFVAMTLIPGAPLSGDVTRPGTTALVPAWSEALIPIILFLFLVPGVVYGIVSGEIRSDRGVANRMTESMSSMGSYIVLAFFAGQAIAWFRQSNLAIVIGVEGGQLIRSIDFGQGSIIAAIVLLCATINLFISSASAKWAFLAPILVPMLASAGMTPELVQAAYRVGDSVTNPIAPLSPYLVIILIVIRRYQPTAGLGTLISLLIPYCAASLVLWTGVLIAWNALGIPLGP